MNDAWFYGEGASRVGPVPSAELERLIITGALNHSTKVWSQRTGWLSLDDALRGASYGPNAMPPPPDMAFIAPTSNTSGMSLVAGYIGIVGCFFAPIGPIAIVLGVMGLLDLKKHPEKIGKARAITGIVLGGVGTALLLWMLVSSLLRAH